MQQWNEAGHEVGLATVVETWGSSPRPVGSHLIINDADLMEGSVSGGCVEGAVIAALQEVMAGHPSRILDFSVTSEQAWEVGLSCGGRIRVLVEQGSEKLALADQVLSSENNVLLKTDVKSGVSTVDVAPETDVQSGLAEEEGKLVFQHVLVQPLRLLIVGAVHISQAMVKMADTLGVEAMVIDPRGAFARKERFEGVNLVEDWPDDVLAGQQITSGTAIVTLTHDSKLDDAALRVALKSNAFYIASLGSRKTHAARLERLKQAGFSDDELSRIHGPAGLDVGAKTPAEIALSVLAQMVSVYRQGGCI